MRTSTYYAKENKAGGKPCTLGRNCKNQDYECSEDGDEIYVRNSGRSTKWRVDDKEFVIMGGSLEETIRRRARTFKHYRTQSPLLSIFNSSLIDLASPLNLSS